MARLSRPWHLMPYLLYDFAPSVRVSALVPEAATTLVRIPSRTRFAAATPLIRASLRSSILKSLASSSSLLSDFCPVRPGYIYIYRKKERKKEISYKESTLKRIGSH